MELYSPARPDEYNQGDVGNGLPVNLMQLFGLRGRLINIFFDYQPVFFQGHAYEIEDCVTVKLKLFQPI
ncbi:MAG: hypothetical protein ABI477_23905, partial [Chryseolinea sp.]